MDLPNLTILKQLGGGASSTVYLAEHHLLQKQVVVKVMKADGNANQWIERFKREAQMMSKMNNPHIPKVSAFFVSEAGEAVLVMEYIQGTSIEELVEKNGAFAAEEARDLTVALAEALQNAHELGIVHRDIKPGNILISDGGSPYILDFGVAKNFSSKDIQRLTATGEFVGTPAYMSPEQCSGKDATAQSDVYALACVLFFMLTGRDLFASNTSAEMMMKHLNAEPDLSSISIRGLRDVLNAGLEKEPTKRIASCEELAKQLKKASLKVTKQSLSPKMRLVLMLLLIAIIGSSVYFIYQRGHADKVIEGPFSKARFFESALSAADKEFQQGDTKGAIGKLAQAAEEFRAVSASEVQFMKLAKRLERYFIEKKSSSESMMNVYSIIIFASIKADFLEHLDLASEYYNKQLRVFLDQKKVHFAVNEEEIEGLSKVENRQNNQRNPYGFSYLVTEECRLLDSCKQHELALKWLSELYEKMENANLLSDTSKSRYLLRAMIANEYIKVEKPKVSDVVADDLKHYAINCILSGGKEYSFSDKESHLVFSKRVFQSAVIYKAMIGSERRAMASDLLHGCLSMLRRYKLFYPDAVAAYSVQIALSNYHASSGDVSLLDNAMLEAFQNAARPGVPTHVLTDHGGFYCEVDHYRSYKNLRLTDFETRNREFEFQERCYPLIVQSEKYSFDEKVICFSSLGQYLMQYDELRGLEHCKLRDDFVDFIRKADGKTILLEQSVIQMEIAMKGITSIGHKRESAERYFRWADSVFQAFKSKGFFHSERINSMALLIWFSACSGLDKPSDSREFEQHYNELKQLRDKFLRNNTVCLSITSAINYAGIMLEKLGRKDEAFDLVLDFLVRWNACKVNSPSSKASHYDVPLLRYAAKFYVPGKGRLNKLIDCYETSLKNADPDNFSPNSESVWIQTIDTLPDSLVIEKQDYAVAVKLLRDTMSAFAARNKLGANLEAACLGKILKFSKESHQNLASELETKRFKELLSSNKLEASERKKYDENNR